MVAQTQKIQNPETLIASVQFEQQENSTASIRGSIPGLITGSITTGDTVLTKESTEAMFKTWITTQAAATPKTQQMNGEEKKKQEFGANYNIENDMMNGEQTKRRYLDSTSYCSLYGCDISPKHHSGNCTNRLADHNKAATIINMLAGVTINCFHYKG